jgi:hypothetical protein
MKKIPIKIGDVDEEVPDETYAYVEDHKMDYDLRRKYLEEFSILFSEAVKGSNIEFELVHYDSRNHYINIPESMHVTRPELRIKNMNHEQREMIVEKLQSLESKFNVYSES